MNEAAAPEYDCAIIGGGFTGLAAAAQLLKRGRSVIIIEKEEQLGGLASGFDVGGYELERFYHHWFTNDTHVPELAAQIGTSDKIVTRKTATGMYYAGNFFRLSTPLDLLRFSAIPFVDRIRTGVATLWVRTIKDWRPLEDKTGKEWLIRLFGKNSYRVIWEPLLIGKFGAHANSISAVWFWSKLTLRGGSRSKDGGEALAYYLGGFAEFARNVGDHIRAQGGVIHLGTAATQVRAKSDNGRVRIETSKGAVIARTALVTTPMPRAAENSRCAGCLQATAAGHSIHRQRLPRARTRPQPLGSILDQRERSELPIRGHHRAHQFRTRQFIRWAPYRLSLEILAGRRTALPHERG